MRDSQEEIDTAAEPGYAPTLSFLITSSILSLVQADAASYMLASGYALTVHAWRLHLQRVCSAQQPVQSMLCLQAELRF